MQGLPNPTKEAEASIPTKNVREDPSPKLKTNGTFKVPRKAKNPSLGSGSRKARSLVAAAKNINSSEYEAAFQDHIPAFGNQRQTRVA
jgi:hypothetical protein